MLFTQRFSFPFCVSLQDTYLPVHQAHHGRFYPHPHSEAAVHVLVVEDGLEAGEHEHQGCIEVALPQGGILIPHEP